MKYMIEYTVRRSGLTYQESEENLETLLKSFSKWQPEEGLKVLSFVAAIEASGGYVLVEATDPKALATFTHKFVSWNDIKVVPVIEVAESAQIAGETRAWRSHVIGG